MTEHMPTLPRRLSTLAALAFTLMGVCLMSHASEAGDGATVAIAIHGGAGTLRREDLDASRESEILSVLEQAVRAGHGVLTAGGSSLDAVTRAVVILEDSPYFNAGRGAVFNAEGKNEMDASIMEGANLDAGAVAAVRNVRNPVLLARRVMSESPHVMLMGEGAVQFAREQGIVFEDDAYFHTDYRWRQLEKARAGNTTLLSESAGDHYSTVGAVALDADGNLAAATSTGGMTNKRWGRVGDSPIIGAGTYADNRSCAVSATGHGEYFIRATVARDICARVRYGGVSLAEAARSIIDGELVAMGGDGGIIAVDGSGNVALEFNTPGMYRASIGPDGELYLGIYAED
jgi:beta-aspartyl-peptidase (threonine type)